MKKRTFKRWFFLMASTGNIDFYLNCAIVLAFLAGSVLVFCNYKLLVNGDLIGTIATIGIPIIGIAGTCWYGFRKMWKEYNL